MDYMVHLFRRDHLDRHNTDFVLGPPGPSFFAYSVVVVVFFLSCSFPFVSVVFNFRWFSSTDVRANIY